MPHGLHDILGVKESDHAYLFGQVQAAEHAGRVTYYERDWTAPRVWSIASALSMTCRSMPQTQT